MALVMVIIAAFAAVNFEMVSKPGVTYTVMVLCGLILIRWWQMFVHTSGRVCPESLIRKHRENCTKNDNHLNCIDILKLRSLLHILIQFFSIY